MKIITVVLISVLLIIYCVLLPIVKKRNMRNNQKAMTQFLEALKPQDSVMLSDGILGEIAEINGEVVQLKIADNVTIAVHKYAIVSKN